MSRARSFWAWGYEDKLPDLAARQVLAEQVGAVLGVACTPRALPSFEGVRLAAPRVAPPPELAAIASVEPRARALHTYGKSYRDVLRAFRLDFAPAPDVVLSPRDDDDVAAALAWGEREKVCIVPFGGGTSVVGGVECPLPPGFQGVASLDLTQLDRVLTVDPISRAALIQAGATGPVLEEQLAAHGLTLRHFPQSFEHSTLGGWLATRAGGHYATLLTHIDNLVESIRMVTPRGVWESRRLPASGAGPSPDRLVLGSEGILGVITQAWMRVVPRPRWRASVSVHYASFAAAADACRAIAQAGLYPSNCRLLDAREALLHNVPTGGKNVLLLGFESADHALAPWMERALAIANEHGGEAPSAPVYADDGEAARANQTATSWRQAFFEAPYLQSTLVTLGILADTFETACTWDQFPALHKEVKRAVLDALGRECGGGVVTCRFTHVYPDGPAPYYTFVGAAKEGHELAQWAAIKKAASDALSACGATITHHHAVGRTHRPWYDRERPDPFALALRGAKSAVDPMAVLNPGVLVDPA
jgi:alkyldihydroxyacetonephosphate synthase